MLRGPPGPPGPPGALVNLNTLMDMFRKEVRGWCAVTSYTHTCTKPITRPYSIVRHETYAYVTWCWCWVSAEAEARAEQLLAQRVSTRTRTAEFCLRSTVFYYTTVRS